MQGDTHLLLVGMNHRTASLEAREALAFTRDERLALARELAGAGAVEALVLTTCNRTEFYVVAADVDSADDGVRRAVHRLRGQDLLAPGPRRYGLVDAAAARHLIRVASGLDSMVLGDVQILGQVKEAIAVAREAGTAGPLLDRLFDRALRAGKRARAETAVSGGVVSVASAAVELLKETLGPLATRRVLVVGAGETARLVARHLAWADPPSIVVANRTPASAEHVAKAVGGHVMPLAEVGARLGEFDAVISATRAPRFVVTADEVREAMSGGAGRRLVIVDLAVPRDVEPSAGEVPGVTLHAIDAIQRVVDRTLTRRQAEVPRVERLVDDELTEFESWRRSRAVTPLLRELRERFEQVRAEELARVLKHAPEEERARAERLTQALVNRLLHVPTVSLKAVDPASDAGQLRLMATRDLFALGRPASRRGADGGL